MHRYEGSSAQNSDTRQASEGRQEQDTGATGYGSGRAGKAHLRFTPTHLGDHKSQAATSYGYKKHYFVGNNMYETTKDKHAPTDLTAAYLNHCLNPWEVIGDDEAPPRIIEEERKREPRRSQIRAFADGYFTFADDRDEDEDIREAVQERPMNKEEFDYFVNYARDTYKSNFNDDEFKKRIVQARKEYANFNS